MEKKVSEEYFKHWDLDGLQKTWYETGELKSESHFKNGLLHGKSITWHKNGQRKSEGTYNSNVYMPDGTRVKVYMPDGSFQPKSALEGPFNEWHENGVLKKSGLYLNGMKHYTWVEWNDKGEEIKSEWNHVF
jgi:antitoxin component YwqK of YwqJK toxin-antitoxin module